MLGYANDDTKDYQLKAREVDMSDKSRLNFGYSYSAKPMTKLGMIGDEDHAPRPNHRGADRKFAHRLKSSLFSGVVAVLFVPGAVYAAEPRDEQPEIIVTASKRSEAISKSPVAISAISQEGLDQAGIRNISALSTAVPNLQIATSAQNTVIGIRGISTNNLSELGNPAVAFYVDGVYFPRPSGMTRVLYDVERVEILRGPQGTLFGRNATAGAVNVITAAPNSTFSAAGDIAIGNYGSIAARAYINVPISENFYVRSSVTQERNDGYQNAKTLTVNQNYYRTDQFGIRTTALWDISDKVNWQLSINYLHDQGAVPQWVNVSPVSQYGNWNTPASRPGVLDKDSVDIRSRLSAEISDGISMSYLAGYSKEDSFNQYSFSDLPNTYRYINDFSSFSHELNVNTDSEKLKTVFGIYYFQEKPHGVLSATGTVRDANYFFPKTQQESKAIFGQGTYSLSDDLRFTAGLRYSSDKAKLPTEPLYFCPIFSAISQTAPGCVFSSELGGSTNRGEWSKINWKLGADFDLSEQILSYISVSTGYKSGGLAAAGAPTYGPENVINFEAGIKGRILEGALSFAASVFNMNYKDQQVSVVRPINGTDQIVTTNAGKSSIKGIELESTFRMTNNDRLDAYVTLLDAKYDEFVGAIDPFVSNTIRRDLSGNRMAKSPRISGQMAYSHTFDLENGAALTPRLSVYAQSKSYLREFNLKQDLQGAYAKVDASLRYESPSQKWYGEAFVYNLNNVDIRTYERVTAGRLLGTYAPPRTYGIRVGAKY